MTKVAKVWNVPSFNLCSRETCTCFTPTSPSRVRQRPRLKVTSVEERTPGEQAKVEHRGTEAVDTFLIGAMDVERGGCCEKVHKGDVQTGKPLCGEAT